MILTEAAEAQVNKLMGIETSAEAMRVGIVGGGCSGFNYTFSFAEEIYETDIKVGEGVVVVDPMSFAYLEDSTVDYTTDIQGERFTITNPKAKATCGCGSSFSV